MAENSKIQWTTHTFNHVRGCVEYAPGCDNCYAAAMSKRNPKTLGVWGSEKAGGTRIVASEEQWKNLKKWNDAAHELSIDPVFFNEPRPRVFVASLADVFEDWQGPMLNAKEERLFVRRDGLWNDDGSGDAGHAVYLTMDDVRARLFRAIDDCPNLTFMLLTKRPENIRRMWPEPTNNALSPFPLKRHNVHLYTSIACQDDADLNIPKLLACRDLSPVLGISAEPLIGPVDLVRYRYPLCAKDDGIGCPEIVREETLDHVIVGGESGHHARPCNVEWIRSIVRQCAAASIPCFVKQLGAKPEYFHDGGISGNESMARLILEDKKGGNMDEWPEDLRVRELPQ